MSVSLFQAILSASATFPLCSYGSRRILLQQERYNAYASIITTEHPFRRDVR